MRKAYNVDLEPVVDFLKENAPIDEIVEHLGKDDILANFTPKEVADAFGKDLFDYLDQDQMKEFLGIEE